MSVARSGLASPSRRGVEPKEIRAQAREVRMASSATRADQGAQDPRRPNAFPEANDDGRFAGSKLGLSETSQHMKIKTEQGPCYCMRKERKAMNRIR